MGLRREEVPGAAPPASEVPYGAPREAPQSTRPERDFAAEALPHLDRLYSLARRIARPPLDPEELTQETYARAFAAYERFEPGSNMRAWLTTILLNLVRTHARRNIPTIVPLDAAAQIAGSEACERAALANIDRSDVLAAVDRLPANYRTAICLVDLCGLSVKEAAAAAGTPVGTVLSRLSRGRGRLAVLLAHKREALDAM